MDSCRYDTFFFLYVFLIKPKLDKLLESYNKVNLSILNNICKEIIKCDESILKEGIWDIFVKLNIKELIENSNYFKRQNNFIQCINLLKDTEYFCFTYKSIVQIL